ncbi:SDR family NAD(P)-dependent oxidoreductase [Brevibacillus fluminis]|uniref:SDR family NAD(P)-dependent oxidoreductase n=1 Tax=Brevibacillus fluminis TaxID=511487 RepID=A0A3M8DD76_9BACL|nr:NAD(P)H-binding protein [Brevibacillus fluminis]RNB85147.1 SDR family NAD(P)-dependent oxidoreductase [Brevibacillus fluminis]
MRIAMTGATGKLGGLIAKELLERIPASDLIVSARQPNAAAALAERGVEVRKGDFDEPVTLADSFTGATKLLLISSSHRDDAVRFRQHQAAIAAAHQAGVKEIVYTSIAFPEKGRLPLHRLHLATEEAIRASGIAYTFLRNAYYTELLHSLRLQEAVDSGILTSPPGEWTLTIASRIDLAQAAATVLTEDGHVNQTYELTAPHAWDLTDLAKALSEVTGIQIVHQVDAAEKNEIYGLLAYSDTRTVSPDLARLAKRPLRTLVDEVRGILGE